MEDQSNGIGFGADFYPLSEAIWLSCGGLGRKLSIGYQQSVHFFLFQIGHHCPSDGEFFEIGMIDLGLFGDLKTEFSGVGVCQDFIFEEGDFLILVLDQSFDSFIEIFKDIVSDEVDIFSVSAL